MIEKRFSPRRVDLLLFLVCLSAYLGLGMYLCLVKRYMPYDALSRLVSAWLVWSGTQTKLATIGFVWPPIPTLALLPLSWIPILVQSWMVLVIVSAFSMAISVVLVYRILEQCRVDGAWRWIFSLLYGLNPLTVVFAVNGMSEAILVPACLAAFYAFLRFWNSNRNMDLIFAAFFFGLLPLIRYEFAVVSAAAGALLIVHCWAVRANRPAPAFREFLEGRLLAFSSMAIYPIFLWCTASWMIMGNPIYFLVNDRSATSLAGSEMSGFGVTPGLTNALRIIFQAWFLVFPIGLLAIGILLFISINKRSWKYLGFATISLVIPVLQFVLLLLQKNIPLLRYFTTAIPFGFLLTALAIGGLRSEYRLSSTRVNWMSALAVLLVFASNVATAYTLKTYPYQDMERQTWRGLVTPEIVKDVSFTEAYQYGQALVSTVKPGSRVLIDTYQYGFGVMLGANNPKLFMDFTDSNYDQAILNPAKFADYVLVPQAEGRGSLYSINREFPNLHDKGASWATLVDGLPDTIGEWRLYQVIK